MASCGDDWESALHKLSRALRDRYFDELGPSQAVRLTHEANLVPGADGSDAGQAALPQLITAVLRELSERGETIVANSLRQWMADPANRRPAAVAMLTENPERQMPLMADASYLAWEVLGHFVSAYDLGDPQEAYRQAVRRGSPRSMLYQVDEALREFNGTNFVEAGRILDHLPQDDALVGIARAIIDNDMPLALSRLEHGGVCESEDPAIARFGKRIRIGALMQSGERNRAIDLARQAIREHPGFSYWRILCSELLAIAAQDERTDSARRKHLADEGMKLALEARDMIRDWNGPSGPAVVMALVCAHLQHDLDAVRRLAASPPAGEATEHEADHPEVVPYLARALGMSERFDELRELDRSGLSEFDSTVIEAWLARHDGEPGAIDLMRRALSLAGDEAQRSAALYGLASLGGVEDLAADEGLQQEPSEAALLASLAALTQGDLDEALHLIQPHKWDSVVHASQFTHVLVELERIDDAVEHLEAGATRFTAPHFLHLAAALLMEASRFGDAEPLVATGLTRATEPALRRTLHGQRIEIANQRYAWGEMLQRAEAAAAEHPDVVQFRWAAIFAICRLGDLQRAYQYLLDHHMKADDRQSHLLEISLRARFDRSLETIDWLLDLADAYPGDEEFLALVMGSIIEASQELERDEDQSTRLNTLVGGFLSEFPSSELFFVVEAPDPETLIGEMRSMLKPGSIQLAEIAEKISLGQLPLGMLQAASGKPYALLLVTGAAGALVAVSLDGDIRQQERSAAIAALDGPVAVDTSSIMLWQRHLDGTPSIMRCFSELLVPIELLADLRAAGHSADVSARGSMGFNPATGGVWVSEADAEQVRATCDAIAEILSLADRCAHVESAGLTVPDAEDVPSQIAPWNAALRVALSRGCALWTDDAVMRALAGHYGVPAFGTYALYEALMATSSLADLPAELELKRSLISSRVADVPLTWAELEAISEHDGTSSAGFVLERQSSWSNPIETFRWFRGALSRLCDDDRAVEAPYLLYSATLGASRATDKDGMPRVAAALLTTALLSGLPHELVAQLVAASRAACQTLTLSSEFDPLPLAASNLAREAGEHIPNPDGAHIGHYVMGIFGGLNEDDLHIVRTAILGPSPD